MEHAVSKQGNIFTS